jgi:uncharacterized protein (DUF362 family)
LQAAAGAAGLTLVGDSSPAAERSATRHALQQLGIPGPFPGRVVEIRDPASVRRGVPDDQAVRRMVARGMAELTGIAEPVEAWRSMFEPGDVVGIKVNPVGNPYAISNYATVHAVVEGLQSAGIKPKDVIVFERYRKMFVDAGYDKHLPEGCRWGGAAENYEERQLDIEGYDPDVFVTLDIVHAKPGVHDPRDERTRRSHLATIITKQVNKIVCIPVLKDHGSGGVTLALKNMSHGFVNNVCRSHGTPDTNTCNLFIPAVVAHPVIRQKAVLQILDGLNAVFQGGPSASKPDYVWEYKALFFATDPVAMDRIGWEIVDAKRAKEGLPPVAEVGRKGKNPTQTEGFDYRQPQHIAGAGALGLGVFDKAKIEHKVIALG